MSNSFPQPPTHKDIARQARQLWQDRGCPDGKDMELWLEAERLLNAGDNQAFTERAKAETAAQSVVEYQISPPIPQNEAIKAALPEKPAPAKRSPRDTLKNPPAAPGNTIKTGPYSA